MSDREELPAAVDAEALVAPADGYHARGTRALGTREAVGIW